MRYPTLSFVAFNESTPASLHCMRVDAGVFVVSFG